MNTKALKKWTEALRSGQYQQCTGTLSNGVGFCCLGVACEVFKDELKLTKRVQNYSNGFDDEVFYNGESAVLPTVVRNFIGLDYDVPKVITPSGNRNIASLNDYQKFTFEELADVIDNNFVVPDYLIEKAEAP